MLKCLFLKCQVFRWWSGNRGHLKCLDTQIVLIKKSFFLVQVHSRGRKNKFNSLKLHKVKLKQSSWDEPQYDFISMYLFFLYFYVCFLHSYLPIFIQKNNLTHCGNFHPGITPSLLLYIKMAWQKRELC